MVMFLMNKARMFLGLGIKLQHLAQGVTKLTETEREEGLPIGSE
jgi:hypothetical protein